MLALSGRCLPRREHAQPPDPGSGSSGDSNLYPGETCVWERPQVNGGHPGIDRLGHEVGDSPFTSLYRRRKHLLIASNVPTMKNHTYLHQPPTDDRWIAMSDPTTRYDGQLSRKKRLTISWVLDGLNVVKMCKI